jgi:hypothetical protein
MKITTEDEYSFTLSLLHHSIEAWFCHLSPGYVYPAPSAAKPAIKRLNLIEHPSKT